MFVEGGYTFQGLYLYLQGLIFLTFFVCIKAGLMREQHFLRVNYVVLIFVCLLAAFSTPFPQLVANHNAWKNGDSLEFNSQSLAGKNIRVMGTDSRSGSGTTWSTIDVTGSSATGDPNGYFIYHGGDSFQKQSSSERLSNAADGAWIIAFIVFNVYALMPFRTLAKCLVGGVLPGLHLAVASLTCSGIPEGPYGMLLRQVSETIVLAIH